jgi:hypothetical protein
LYAAINGWTPTNLFWRSCLVFICQERSSFHSYQKPSVLLFLLLLLVFVFALICIRSSYIYLSRCIFASGPCWFSSKELD